MSRNMKKEEEDIPSPASKIFANHLSKYAYTHNSTSPSRLASSSAGPSSPSSRVRSRTQASPVKSGLMPVVEVPASPSKRRIPQSNPESGKRTYTPLKKGKRSIANIDQDSDTSSSENGSESDYAGSHKNDGEKRVTPKKRKVREKENNEKMIGGKGKSPAKKPRAYAPPELYEHLRPVNDLMREDMDILFCGINPGKRSSTMGHHFSHPTNKFWRSLHLSGLTPRLLDPTEDHLMIDYGYGLTNLVDRPTSEQSELSTLEMRLNVYNLTEKFLKCKPKLVCFVGKKIWDVYESVVKRTAVPISIQTQSESRDHQQIKLEEVCSQSTMQKIQKEEEEGVPIESISVEEEIMEDKVVTTKRMVSSQDVKLEKIDDLNSSSSLSPPPPVIDEPPIPNNSNIYIKVEERDNDIKMENSNELELEASQVGLNSRRINKNKSRDKQIKVKHEKELFDATKPRKYRIPHHDPQSKNGIMGYTYFWVVPNTSGLERTQLPEQIINFTALRKFLEQLKSDIDPGSRVGTDLELGFGSGWKDIDPIGVESTVEGMKKAALLKKL